MNPVASLTHELILVTGAGAGSILGAAIGLPIKRRILRRFGLRMVYTKKGVRYVPLRKAGHAR